MFTLGSLNRDILQLVNYANVEQLLPTQDLCLSYALSRQKSLFSLVGIGNGKTILCNILAAYFALKADKQVIVLNRQKNLSMRNGIQFDNTIAKKLNLLVGFDGSKKNENYQVIFMCDDELQQYLKVSEMHISDTVLIIDEADQVLFTEQGYKAKEKDLQAWK